MTLAVIPPRQRKQLDKIRRAMLRDLADSLEGLNKSLAIDVRAMTRQLRKDGWTNTSIHKRAKELMRGHYGRAEKVAIEQVKDAAGYGQDYARRVLELSPKDYVELSPSKIKWMTDRAYGGVDAALSLVYGKTAGSKVPYKGLLKMSKRLHSLRDEQARKVAQYVMRSIREGQSLGFASRELVNLGKGGLGGKAELPKVIKELLGRAGKLNRMYDGAMDKELLKLRHYMQKINVGGRVGGAYQELIQNFVRYTDGKMVPGQAMGKAVETWVHHKQRYFAERIIETETSTAYRSAMIADTGNNKALVGYIWHMNRSHRRTLKCDCEVLDGMLLDPKKAESLIGGVHPFCNCTMEPVFDKEAIFSV